LIVLLLTSALFLSVVSVTQPPKKAHGIALTVNFYSSALVPATSGRYGDVVMVRATGSTSADWTSCSITTTTGNIVTEATARVFGGVAYGSFKVGNGPGAPGSGVYTITVTCGPDSGTKTFQVLPYISFTPAASLGGRKIVVTGVGFASDAVSCTISGAGGILASQICTVSGGTLGSTSSFIVSAGVHLAALMTVHPDAGNDGTRTFTRVIGTADPAGAAWTDITSAAPGYGSLGVSYRVNVVGGGFTGTNTSTPRSCTLTDAPVGLIATRSCQIIYDYVVGSFEVSSTAAGAYTVTVTDDVTLLVTAAIAFTANPSPTLAAPVPANGYAGQTVADSQALNTFGDGASADAGPCTLSSIPVGLVASSFCLIDNSGSIWLGATTDAEFTVSGTVLGQNYQLTVTGRHGDPSAASPNFLVTAHITVSGILGDAAGYAPTGSLPGTTVTVSGTGFLSTDASTCTLDTLVPGPDIVTAGYTCTVSGVTGVLSGSFVVAGGVGAINQTYTVTATGAAGLGTAAIASFDVEPRIVLSPPTGLGGATISILGSGFQAGTGIACVAYGSTPLGLMLAGSSCIANIDGTVTGAFTVDSSALNGAYTFSVTGVTLGVDVATTTFIKGTPAVLTITPYTGPTTVGAVSVTATFTSGDAGLCNSMTASAGSNLFAGVPTPTCTVSSSGALTASFTVNANAQGGTWTITVITAAGNVGTGNFAVTPTMTLNPTSGESFTLVSVAGSGFTAADAAAGCASLYSSPLGLPNAVSCSISAATYHMTGSFVVSGTVAAGSYSVIYPSSLGLVSATTPFTKSVSAFNLDPNSGPTGTIVSVTGTGFPSTDATCAITAVPNIVSTQTCSITGGVVTGSFTVSGTAVPGVSTVTVTSLASGTSKSAPFLLTPTIVLSPTSGRANTPVSVTGSNFAAGDIGCTITSDPTGLISTYSCVLVASVMSGSFVVAVVSSGNYTVYITGSSGDYGFATFIVPSAPALTLYPPSGASGTPVTATGSNFAGTTCQLTSSPSGLFLSSSCSLSGGSLTSGTGFTVSSGAAVGTAYTVTVTTNLGGTDSATASFIVAAGPLGTLTLAPTSGPIGTPVSGQATGFTTDTSCQLTATPPEILSSASCTITGGGNANVGFIVSSSANPGEYTIVVVGNTGTSAATTTPFTVTATPSFILSANPSSLTLNPGGTANVAVTVQSFGGFSSPVALVASLPAGVSGGLAPNPVTPPSGGSADSTFSLVVSSTAPSTTAIITVAGAGEGLSTQTTITLVIQSTVTTATSVSTATGPWTPPSCVIATATFGSEASPAVQFLRNFRDKLVLSTTAGSAFMQVFNAWYYSFSPSVAQFIASNDPIRAPIRVLLYPLLGILGVSAFTYSLFSGTPEFAVVMAGLVASSLIGLTYFTAPALVGMQALLRKKRIRAKILGKASLASLAIALTMLTIGEVAGSFLTLAIASSAVVLTCVIAVPTIVAFAMLHPNRK
jgi:hypothetical protein